MFAFETKDIYWKAFRANKKIYKFLKANNTIPLYYKNQFGRASLSIMLNIAEGSAKFSIKDRKNFLIIARASAFECASLLNFLFDEGEITLELKTELYSSFDEISRILYIMIKNLDSK